MNKVLITGASGFIGQSLCDFLVGQGLRVKAALRTPPREPYSHEYVIIEDIEKIEGWQRALEGVDRIIHLAAQAHGVHKGHYIKDQQDPNRLFHINTHGTRILSQAACKAGVRHFVYISSVKVNGERTSSKPFIEEDLPQPIDAYGQSKLQAEREVQAICQEGGMSYAILRPPLVYGPSVKGNFRDLLKVCATGVPLPFYGLHNKRSLIYIENLLEVIYLALTHSRARNEIFLLRDDLDLSTWELIMLLRRAMNLPSHLFYCPLGILRFIFKILKREEAFLRLTSSLQVNDKKLRLYLDWQPRFSVEQGIEKTVKWYLTSIKQKI